MSQHSSSWCPYTKYLPSNPQFANGDYSVVKKSPVPPHIRHNFNTSMPPSPHHGGLFSGPPSYNPWNAIPVTPTMTNYVQNNLRSANPPPGATQQYVGTNRLGNNYVSMPGVYWHNPDNMNGKYAIKTTHQSDFTTFQYQPENYLSNVSQLLPDVELQEDNNEVVEEEEYRKLVENMRN